MNSFLVSVTVLILFITIYSANQPCTMFYDTWTRPFHKIKNCYRSDLPIVARTNVLSVSECMDFARERRGLAINFSPPGATKPKTYQDYYFVNCQVLGCPEIGNSSTLIRDSTFDYYSLFGNPQAEEVLSASCISSVGLFRVSLDKVNYTEAIIKCQEIGGDLADVVSESRTYGITNLVGAKLEDWYKIAYVGLDDIDREGYFKTPTGLPLNCLKFRAWGPGHPRNKDKHDDCVAIDSENAWKVMNCEDELSSVCELYPMSPPRPPKTMKTENDTCSGITDKRKRKACRKTHKEHNISHKTSNTTANRCNN